MKQNEYEVGEVYLTPDGARWIFLGYYLEMPVWKVEGKHQTKNNIDKVGLPGRSSSKVSSRWKKIFMNYFKTRTRFFYKSGKIKTS